MSSFTEPAGRGSHSFGSFGIFTNPDYKLRIQTPLILQLWGYSDSLVLADLFTH